MKKLVKFKKPIQFEKNYSLLNNLDGYLNRKVPISINKCKIIEKVSSKYTTSLDLMIKRVNSEPKPKMLYSGIKEGSVGIVFGPSKSGKWNSR